jgi:hypothetical protein
VQQLLEKRNSSTHRKDVTLEPKMPTTTTTSPHDPKLAATLAIQNESLIRISILRDQHRLTQVRADALTQARINVLHSDSKQKLSLEKKLHEERRKAMAKEIEVRVEKAEMEKEKREQFLRGMIL